MALCDCILLCIITYIWASGKVMNSFMTDHMISLTYHWQIMKDYIVTLLLHCSSLCNIFTLHYSTKVNFFVKETTLLHLGKHCQLWYIVTLNEPQQNHISPVPLKRSPELRLWQMKRLLMIALFTNNNRAINLWVSGQSCCIVRLLLLDLQWSCRVMLILFMLHTA